MVAGGCHFKTRNGFCRSLWIRCLARPPNGSSALIYAMIFFCNILLSGLSLRRCSRPSSLELIFLLSSMRRAGHMTFRSLWSVVLKTNLFLSHILPICQLGHCGEWGIQWGTLHNPPCTPQAVKVRDTPRAPRPAFTRAMCISSTIPERIGYRIHGVVNCGYTVPYSHGTF